MARPPRTPRQTTRYGIAEWFGKDITQLSPQDRQNFGQIAARQDSDGLDNVPQPCPFLSTLIPNARCNKPSGVCSIRKFSPVGDGTAQVVPDDKVVTVCPIRFLEPVAPGVSLFQWIADKMLGIQEPTVVKETPFLRKVSDRAAPPADPAQVQDMAEEAEEEKKAGRIDWIVVNPSSMNAAELEWCAIETQALYFSGDRMRPEFDAYAAAPSAVLYPVGKRRPDYRSSGPKRLAPQLDVKVPVLRNWGKKVAVVIDRFFFENMNQLDDAYPRARNDAERRDNADVVWFVVDYDPNLKLQVHGVTYTTLDSSRRALNATEPFSKGDFTSQLKATIDHPGMTNKVFKA